MSVDGKIMLGVAFKWATYATNAKTGASIIVPAISFIDFDAEGKFAYTRDFFGACRSTLETCAPRLFLHLDFVSTDWTRGTIIEWTTTHQDMSTIQPRPGPV